jgi:hypothetical protein
MSKKKSSIPSRITEPPLKRGINAKSSKREELKGGVDGKVIHILFH